MLTLLFFFREGTIDIWVAPRRLTICGEPCTKKKESAPVRTGSNSEGERIFRVTASPLRSILSRSPPSLGGDFLRFCWERRKRNPSQRRKRLRNFERRYALGRDTVKERLRAEGATSAPAWDILINLATVLAR